VPSAGSEIAGRAALALAEETAAARGLLLVCLSGGASSMLAVPARGLTIEDKAAAASVLLHAGLDIADLNLVRRHMSAIKGGRLAARAARSITLAISDVTGAHVDEPAVIGSGPTVGDRSTREEAYALLVERDLLRRLPARVIAHFESGSDDDPVVARDDPRLQQSAYWIVASRHDAMRHAAVTAERLGYDTHVIDAPLSGTARDGWRHVLAEAGARRPRCVIASGETTVEVRGRGRGGRNQELAAGALPALAALGNAALASINTDGVDGPTDAAGAIVDSTTLSALGAEAIAVCGDALARNDTHPLLESVGALVRTGPTGTNVGDLVVVVLQ
jgi:glycerate-2-kinase